MDSREIIRLDDDGVAEIDVHQMTPEDLAPLHAAMANVIGMEQMIALSDAFGGTSVYIPQRRELIKTYIFNCIAKEFNGFNRKELAIKYRLSETTVYNIIRDQIVKGSAKRDLKLNIPGQMNIADFDV